MTLLDKSFSEFIERNHNPTTDKVSTHLSKFGAEASLVVLAGYYVGGQLWDSPKARSVAQDGIAASIIASGMITPTLKLVFGRARHDQGEGPYDLIRSIPKRIRFRPGTPRKRLPWPQWWRRIMIPYG